MLRLSRDRYMEMVAHCLAGLPDEACGLLVGSYGGDEATHLFPTPNAAASAMVYEIDPKDMLRVDRAARELGADIMGVFHSHTHTDAYPSPTDVAQATDPGWHYVLVSLRDTHPVVRSYAIVDGQITEEPVDVPGLDVPGLDVPGLDVPGLDVPGLDVPGLDVPGLDVPGLDVPGLDVPGLDVPGLDPGSS